MDGLAEQYKTDENLRVRIQTHQKYTVGPALEPAVDAALALAGDEELLDVGTGPGDFPGRLKKGGHRGRLVGVDKSSGMVKQGSAKHHGVEYLVADAEKLPFPEQSFDVVTARHMLYHVADIPRAILEIHRVLRVGGHFLAVTNASSFMEEYADAINEAIDAVEAGGTKIGRVDRDGLLVRSSATFTEQSGPAYIRKVFGQVEVQIIESALVFEEVEPVIAYFDSCKSLEPVDENVWSPVRAELAGVITKRLKRGAWRVGKSCVLLSALRS